MCMCGVGRGGRGRGWDGGPGRALTHVDDPLLGSGLPRVPMLPEPQLLCRDLVIVEDDHHHTLQAQRLLFPQPWERPPAIWVLSLGLGPEAPTIFASVSPTPWPWAVIHQKPLSGSLAGRAGPTILPPSQAAPGPPRTLTLLEDKARPLPPAGVRRVTG